MIAFTEFEFGTTLVIADGKSNGWINIFINHRIISFCA
jgi:hypothetical protein